ncbi:MAG TPA: hypothetical protein VLL73_06605 [Desulfurivibrionaceae bacterium]|nr:hypothetical protein [Desulfurivibrionaceae bacterium]
MRAHRKKPQPISLGTQRTAEKPHGYTTLSQLLQKLEEKSTGLQLFQKVGAENTRENRNSAATEKREIVMT